MKLIPKPPQTSFQKKANRLAYALFIIGAIIAALGQYGLQHTDLGIPLVAIGIILVALSLIPAIIANPWMIDF